MENELQGNILGTGFTGNGFEISRNPNVSSLDGFFVKERCDRFSMAFASLCTTITSDKIHLIKTTKLLRVRKRSFLSLGVKNRQIDCQS